MNDRIKLNGWDFEGELTKQYGAWTTVRLKQDDLGLGPDCELEIDPQSPIGSLGLPLKACKSIRHAERIAQLFAAMLDGIAELPIVAEKEEVL